MNLKELKIGYVPYLPDLSQPADRRRFPFFAKTNNIPFEIADTDNAYDIVLLTAPANLSKWLLYKKKHPETKFIFEMVDSLIFPSDIFSTLFKGLGRFILQKESLLFIQYKRLIIEWLKIADIVVCSSTEVKKNIERWNKNVVVSLDYLQNEYKLAKTDYSIGGKMKLLWEGQGIVLSHFLYFKDVLEQVSSFCELHIITEKKYPSFGNLKHTDVKALLDKLPITTIFHEWNIDHNPAIFSQCDCGFIPLSKKNLLAWHKPANKLISFWFSGLPTIVSDTPAYVELMNGANSKLYCSDTDDWVSKIKWIRDLSAPERKQIAARNLDFVQKNYCNEALNTTWQQIFERLNFLV